MMERLAVPLLPSLFPFPRHAKAAPASPGEVQLLQEGGVLVTSERVVARGRTQALAEVLSVETVRRSPRMKPVLLALVLGVTVGLPALSALSVSGTGPRGLYEGALVLAALTVFGSIARLVLAEDSYQLVLNTRGGAWRVLSRREPQHLTRVAELLQEAVATARRRR
ncbi:DUF6232 family protein [Pyxidicoccus xibeiensis]|uniref:DUF6232 family protein n=1 Tax=Pyxidicoccus xibeiensis TaxID=2906759 RepID=UPI0020A7A304|nr:DUF6232 family protein [Pyxidicoccus xibeiensis]MCP3137683.1 DUF6232 family protein [Pyxidicoccus xibeiensis]